MEYLKMVYELSRSIGDEELREILEKTLYNRFKNDKEHVCQLLELAKTILHRHAVMSEEIHEIKTDMDNLIIRIKGVK